MNEVSVKLALKNTIYTSEILGVMMPWQPGTQDLY